VEQGAISTLQRPGNSARNNTEEITMATTQSGVGLTVKFFGKLQNQTLAEFKAEWDALGDANKAQLVRGLSDGTLTY
jgi:hypothetical protein